MMKFYIEHFLWVITLETIFCKILILSMDILILNHFVFTVNISYPSLLSKINKMLTDHSKSATISVPSNVYF